MENTILDINLLALIKEIKFHNSNDLEATLNLITRHISKIANVDRVGIWIFQETEKNMQSINCHSLFSKLDQEYIKDIVLFENDYPFYFKALREQRVIMAADARNHHATKCFKDSYLNPLGIQSLYDTPIWLSDTVIGVLCLEYFQMKDEWGDKEKYFLTSVADLIGKIYEKKKYFDVIENLENLVHERTKELEKTLENLKSAQQTLISNEKLASLGSLTAGIAHEMKNPLNLISNSAKIIDTLINEEELNLETAKDIKVMTEIIINSSKKANNIVTNMMEQSRNDRDFSITLIDTVLEDAFKMAYHNMRATKPIDIAPFIHLQDTCELHLSKADFKRAIINILDNSYYSIFHKMKNSKNYMPEISLISFIDVETNNYVIEIKDNATGMNQNDLSKIFEPFFTTKKTGTGTGLGLSMTYDIIKKHSGEIFVETKEGESFKTTIRLPRNN